MKDCFSVGRWVVQPQINTISADEKVIRIEPKVMEVLIRLARNVGEVVSKESLLEEVWADTFVTNEVVTTAIFELRKALGDEARNPRFIQTIPKKGYRLIAPVAFDQQPANQEASAASIQADSSIDRSESSSREPVRACRRLRPALAVAVAIIGVAVALLGSLWVLRERKGSDETGGDSVAMRDQRKGVVIRAEVSEACAKGRELWDKRSYEGLKSSIDYFERAIRLDPGYAPAYAGLADSYSLLVLQNHLPPDEGYSQAKKAAILALQLNEHLAEAWASLALIEFNYDWDWSSAEQRYKRAIELDSNYAIARGGYSQLLLAAGRLDEAQREIEKALEIAPDSLGLRLFAGSLFYRLHQYDQAEQHFHKALAIDPNNSAAYKALGHTYEKRSRLEQAGAAYRKSLELSGLPPVAQFTKSFDSWSRKDDAQYLLNKLSYLLSQKYVRPSFVAGLYAFYGEKERALDWLEKAFKERDSNLLFLKTDDSWNGLRDDPRFVNLEQRIIPAL